MQWLFIWWQVYDNGMQTRSFQYVSDLVSGLIALMSSNCSEPVNLGNPQEYTINEIARVIRQLVGMWWSFCLLSCNNDRCIRLWILFHCIVWSYCTIGDCFQSVSYSGVKISVSFVKKISIGFHYRSTGIFTVLMPFVSCWRWV